MIFICELTKMSVHCESKESIPFMDGVKVFHNKLAISSEENVAVQRHRLCGKQMSVACLKTLESNANKNNLRHNRSHTKSMSSFHHVTASECYPENASSLETVSKRKESGNSTANTIKIDEIPNPTDKKDELFLKVTCDALKNISADKLTTYGYVKNQWIIADNTISCILISPLVIGSWHGLWGLMDVYQKYFPHGQSAICGIFLHICFALLRGKLQAERNISGILQYVLSRIYCWLFMAGVISHWRGGWMFLPGIQIEGQKTIIKLSASLAALIVLKSTKNLLTVPFFVQVDSPETSYYFHTRFKKNSREPLLYLLDCLFSVIVVGSLVVFVWRGAWDLLDVYLYPENRALSAWISFVIGYGLTVLTFLLQGAARRACTKLKGAQRLIVADLFLLLSFVATINVWRSIWTLLDTYFMPDNKEFSNWITHVGCFVLLLLLNCANSVLVRGVYIDAEEEGGQCVVFPCYYLRLFFQKEKIKKRAKRSSSATSDVEGAGEHPLLAKSPLPTIVKSQNTQTSANHITMHPPNQNEPAETDQIKEKQ